MSARGGKNTEVVNIYQSHNSACLIIWLTAMEEGGKWRL